MKETVPVAQATSEEVVLPERVQEALGQLVGAAKEGLLALSVGVGLGVLSEMLEEEVDEVVGPRGKHNPDRIAVRHGHDDGEVTLGGRRVDVRRPRVRTADGRAEVPRATYEHFTDRDPLARVLLERMLAGVSTRRYRRTQEPVGEEVEIAARSTSTSAVSRTFVERTRHALGELMSRQLADLRLAVMMIDGIELKERMMIVALVRRSRCAATPQGRRDRRPPNKPRWPEQLKLGDAGPRPSRCCSPSEQPSRNTPGARPKGRSALAGTEEALDVAGLSLARDSDRQAGPDAPRRLACSVAVSFGRPGSSRAG